jgi:hypothetical protein
MRRAAWYRLYPQQTDAQDDGARRLIIACAHGGGVTLKSWLVSRAV